MATVWELITESSTLSVQAGTTLWDHLNNLGAGAGNGGILPVFYREITIEEVPPPEILVSTITNEVIVEEQPINEVIIDEDQIEVGEL